MSTGGIAPTLPASLHFAGASAGAGVNGAIGAAGLSSVGPAAVLSLSSGASPAPAIESISMILAAELQGKLDLAA